jgi:Bacterial TSP3 repeat
VLSVPVVSVSSDGYPSRVGSRWTLLVTLALAADLVASQQRISRGPIDDVQQSTDVAWLERIASSPAFAEQVQRASRVGMAKLLRGAAYARLGAIGTPESLAAVGRIEQSMADVPLTPPTVPLGVWPSVSWHMRDVDQVPMATAIGPDGTTFAVVAASLLGGFDLFLISTRTPDDPQSWSRPKLLGPAAQREGNRGASLAFRGPATLVLATSGTEMQFALDDIQRDSDGDGWTDVEEGRIGTNPHAPDSDGDGLPDGRDVCPLWPLPPANSLDDNETILQRAVFAAFALTGSRQMLYVTPATPRVHVRGYGGPIIFDRPLPRSGSSGGVYVSWRIRERSAADAVVEVTDWEGLLAAGGQDVFLKKVLGRWTVVAVKATWVS